ncbi:hypothetical protein [Silvimonas soli]|uniref:hypothetical protein n=1 Tax=Silvimonas soli TaxID=2980100 RepID=UPI0024B3C124|nr:hypothetical protein [Silvimonas soli]
MDNNIRQLAGMVLAGAAGSALGVWLNRKGMTEWPERAGAFAGGFCASYYLTPMIMRLAHEDNDERAFAFMIGAFGMTVTTALWRLIANSDWFDLFRTALFSKLGISTKEDEK